MEMRRGRPRSQVMNSGQPEPQPHHSRRPGGSLPTQQYRCYENDEEIHNERKRQIIELKTRMRQLEKTLRWWADCATNWREKWSQLRIERNKVREELKVTQAQLEMANQELDGYRKGRITPTTSNNSGKLCTPTTPNYMKNSTSQFMPTRNKRTQTDSDFGRPEDKMEKSIYLLRLEEANRTIIAEREDKIILHQTVEKLQRELQDLQELYDNLKKELYELKDYSESAAEPEDLLSDEGQEEEEEDDGEEEEECLGAVGYSAEYYSEHHRQIPFNSYNYQQQYQSSLVIELPEKSFTDASPILQIVEEDDINDGEIEIMDKEKHNRVFGKEKEQRNTVTASPKNEYLERDVNDDLFSVSVLSEELGRSESDTKLENGQTNGNGIILLNKKDDEKCESTTELVVTNSSTSEKVENDQLNDLISQNNIEHDHHNNINSESQHLNNLEEDLLKEYSILKKLDELNIANLEKEMNNESVSSLNNTAKIFDV